MVIRRFADGVAIVCGPGMRQPKCETGSCGKPGPFLCDFVPGEGTKTCDRRFCSLHGAKATPTIDYCAEHTLEMGL